MANQPNRQQPFRFWLPPSWTNQPPRRPPTTMGQSQTRTPATPSQPEAQSSQTPNQRRQKPTPLSPSSAQAPTNSLQPPPIAQGAPRTPSPSSSSPRKPEPKRQPTLPSQVASQQPSPSKPEPETQPTLPSQVASQQPSPPSPSKTEPKRQSTLPSQVASQPQSRPSPSEPDQKTQPPGEPEPERQPKLSPQAASQPSSPSPSEPGQETPPPSPSSEPEQKLQPSPPSQGISLPQPANLGEARLPSPSPPTTQQTKSLPQEPQTALDASSSTVPAHETQLQNTSKAQESVPEPNPQLTESANQISQKSNPNQIPTDSSMKDVSAETTLTNPNKPLQESQPQEIKEKPTTIPEQKQENKPGPLPKLVQTLEGRPEERTKSKVEVNREKFSSKPENNVSVRKSEEKLEMSPTETQKPQRASEETKEKNERRADPKQNINPEKTSETEPISELIKKYNSLTKPETHSNKPVDRASEESETKIQPRIAIQVADSRPNTNDHTSEIKMSEPERIMHGNVNVKERTPENGNGASSRESRIVISTNPKRVSADGEQANFQKEIKEGLSKLVQKLNTGQHPGGDQGVTIITLAGENKGATMTLDFDEGSKQNNRGFKLTDKVGATKGNHVEEFDRADNANPAITTSVNSNVQNINNSLLHESSCSEGDPGVHLIISSKPKEPVYLIRKKEKLLSQKTASSTLQPQKYTYETNVRRRCLRGLLLESSESDPENPKKPPRHGCRVSCDDKKKGKAEDDGASASNRNRRNNEGKLEEMF